MSVLLGMAQLSAEGFKFQVPALRRDPLSVVSCQLSVVSCQLSVVSILLHEMQEIVKQVEGIVWSWSCFRMVLNRKHG